MKPFSLFAFILIFVIFPAYAASTCDLPFELKTKGSKITDACDNPILLKAVNWHGFHTEREVAAGLDKKPLNEIVKTIKKGNLNAVRLTFSNRMLHSKIPVRADWVSANPQFINKLPVEIFYKVVDALTAEHIIVILNNHTTTSEWCCNYDYNGLWYHPKNQTTQEWLNDWMMLAHHFKDNPYVAAFDLRNEVRPTHFYDTIFPINPNWGKGNQSDWKLAATNAGNLIHGINKKPLIIVEGINWTGIPLVNGYRPLLAPIRTNPILLNQANKLVYEAHFYGYTGPKHTGDDKYSYKQTHYRDMNAATLIKALDDSFGFVQEENHLYTAPVFLGEFGLTDSTDLDLQWFERTVQYLIQHKISWAYWELGGLMNEDWSDFKTDWRSTQIKKLNEVIPS